MHGTTMKIMSDMLMFWALIS